jgi:cellulose synthase/poly-beta-1,6-N-acetylglucosamine synthase-like glycosyltransferase
VDGGSCDNTPTLIERFAFQHRHELSVQLLSQPGCNISQGRNAAIEAASFEIIAATDAGTRLPLTWLAELTSPFFEQTNTVQVVSGFFRADPAPGSPFQIAMGATVLPVEKEIQPEKFLPSSRSVAFTKSSWRKVGGYPEWLDYCEDLIFDLNLKRQGYHFHWQPKACVLFAPRQNLTSFFKQYYRYARGDGKANLFLKRHLLRYFTYLIFLPLMLGLTRKYPWLSLPFLITGVGYLKTPYWRLFRHLPEFQALPLPQKALALIYVPLIRLTGDLAKMVGYPPGIWWRISNKNNHNLTNY